MASKINQLLSWLLLLSLLVSATLIVICDSSITVPDLQIRKEYIVYLGDRPKDAISALTRQKDMVRHVLGRNFLSKYLECSFKRSFNGFVVKLNKVEMLLMSKMNGVVSIFPNVKKQLHTTRSWDFLGLAQTVNRTTVESDIVIGVLDSGAWPESESFSDGGMGPPPSKWKGTCSLDGNFTCNNKIIGGRYYKADGVFGATDLPSPRDTNGHGTHTASTVAGNAVSMASMLGLGSGTARGGVPSARIAVYKVCWSDGCSDADILAAFDDAIADGVDIISLSVGGPAAKNYFQDAIAIGSFHSMKNGILTSVSAGNSGPDFFTTSNVSPWALTVAANTIDRKFLTQVQLGNNQVYVGVSLNTFDLHNKTFPLIYGGDAPNITAGFNYSSTSRFCLENTLNSEIVSGKIVLCDRLSSGRGAFAAGAAGTVMHDDGTKDEAIAFPLAASYLSSQNGSDIYYYAKLTRNPTATIMKSYEGNDTLAPYVAEFSSRGPSNITYDILKPDISAPGVDILAAWPTIAPITNAVGDDRRVAYNIISGTSMACPHATAAAAYIKSYHPTWSPAALKSALMTTATPMSPSLNPDAELAYGSGQIDPLKALNPGLVYDADVLDYVQFLCSEGYSTALLQSITGDNTTCSSVGDGTVWDLNYPSFALSTVSPTSFSRTYRRTVTNVGSASSTYSVKVNAPVGLSIQVDPSVLSFTAVGEKLSYTVSIGGMVTKGIVSASLVWDDGVHQVRSPIVVFVLAR